MEGMFTTNIMTITKKLIWFGPPYSYSGYALHNRAMIFEMLKLGWDIRLVPTEEHIPAGLIGKNLLQSLVKNTHIEPKNTIAINLVPPPAIPLYAAHTILFTTIESKTVHEGFFRRCTLFDEVWVPCKMNIDSMRSAGYPKSRLYHCPEGVYSSFWNPSSTPDPKYKSDLFTFFYNGDWSYRKGIDIMLRAYAEAFLPTDPVRLLLLVHYQGNSGPHSQLVIPDEVRYICKTHSITKLPKIEFIFDFIDDTKMPAVYKCADCYIAPTRGEAWGLPIIQALSCGIPAIVPRFGGHMDYCNKHICYLTDIEKFDVMDDKVNLAVDFYKYQQFPFPDVNSFASAMRYAYIHREENIKKGKAAAAFVGKHFSWTNSAQIMQRRLLQIYEDRHSLFNV